MKIIQYTVTLVISVVVVSTITYFVNTSIDRLPEGVDMGTGIIWDSKNIGAEECRQPGYFFVWGAQKGIKTINDRTDEEGYTNKSIAQGTPELLHNAAEEIRGEGWRLPTPEEVEKLLSDEVTKKKYKIINNSLCVELTSHINGNKLTLPVMPITENDTVYSTKYLTATCDNTFCFNPYYSTGADTTRIAEMYVEYYYGDNGTTGNIRAVHDPIFEKRSKKVEKEKEIKREITVRKTLDEEYEEPQEETPEEKVAYYTATVEHKETIGTECGGPDIDTASSEERSTIGTECYERDTLTQAEVDKIVHEAKRYFEETEYAEVIDIQEQKEKEIVPYDMQLLGLKCRVRSVTEKIENSSYYYEFDSNGRFSVFRNIKVKKLKITRDKHGRITNISYINYNNESTTFNYEYKYGGLVTLSTIGGYLDPYIEDRDKYNFGIPSRLKAVFYEWNEDYKYVYNRDGDIRMWICTTQDYDYNEEITEDHINFRRDDKGNWTEKTQIRTSDHNELKVYRKIEY